MVVFEEDASLSLDTKAGTTLTRTLEVLNRYDALGPVLRAAVRIDEIGDIDRQTNKPSSSVVTGTLTEDTRFPFVINIPQNDLEPALAETLARKAPGAVRLGHKVVGFEQHDDHVEVQVEHDGEVRVERVRYLLACDGGRSPIREQLGVKVEGHTLAERYMLVDILADLDVANPRDYPYLAYFGDPKEWMIIVRQPHCWRFLYPLPEGAPEPTAEELAEKARRFIGDVDQLEVLGQNVYTVHHRVADRWRDRRVFLMGDAAHLITPMWALGLNTGVLDASNLPWRLAWVERGWATAALLDGYEAEQAPVAVQGSGEMAEAARLYMSRKSEQVASGGDAGNWGNAFTRGLLGVEPRRRRHRRLVDGADGLRARRGARRRPRSRPAAGRPGRDRPPARPLRRRLRRPLLHRYAAAPDDPGAGQQGAAPLHRQPLGRAARLRPARPGALRPRRARHPPLRRRPGHDGAAAPRRARRRDRALRPARRRGPGGGALRRDHRPRRTA